MHEQQADRVAEEIVSGPRSAPIIGRVPPAPALAEADAPADKRGGRPLPDAVRAFMEPRFMADFSQVRVHTDGDAADMNRQLGARAFAHGADIYYGAGRFPANDSLTAHELTHVVQQDAAPHPIIQTAPDSEYPEAETDTQALIDNATAAIERAGAITFRYLAANMEGSEFFVLFDDYDVNKLHRYLLDEWLGATDVDESLENTATLSAPPKWVGEFRVRALNLMGRKNPDAEYLEQQQLGALAVQLADSVAAETPAQQVRRIFVEEIDKRIGTTVMSKEAIEAERNKPAEKGLTPKNFTTCIAFFTQVTQEVVRKAGLSGPLIYGPNYYKEIAPLEGKENLPPGAWHPCTPTTRPKPGDLLIFRFAQREKSPSGTTYEKGYFAHISILRSIEVLEAPTADGATEKWISVDGGGVKAATVDRYFNPETCIIKGPGTTIRTLHGWIDVEKMAEAKLNGPVTV